MGIFSKFEGRVEDTFEGAANKISGSPLSPVQIAKKAEKQMRRGKIVGAGRQYVPTLFTVLVNADDDRRLFGYYPTLAGETETYLAAKAASEGLVMDGQPLVRFIADKALKRGKFEVVAELVAAPIVDQLRQEEMDRYGIGGRPKRRGSAQKAASPQRPQGFASNPQAHPGQAQSDGYAHDVYDAYGAYGAYGDAAYDAELYGSAYADGVYDDFDESYDQQPFSNSPAAPLAHEGKSGSAADYEEQGFEVPDPITHPRSRLSALPEIFETPPSASQPGSGKLGSLPLPLPLASIKQGQRAADIVEAFNAAALGTGNASAPFTPPTGGLIRASLLNATDNRTYDLTTARLLLGRDSSNDIAVDDINASRTHAEIRFEPQGVWVIADLNSTNGTLVNGEEVAIRGLYDGDYITIGMTNFVFIQE